jgi:peroxiredoxin
MLSLLVNRGDDAMTRLMPLQPVPELDLPLVGGGRFVLSDSRPELFTMLLFYRGYHCPVCHNQLDDLKEKLPRLAELGVEPLAVSMDSEVRAGESVEEWELEGLRVAYGMSERTARAFGLYISSAISDKEPERFSEPGLLLVNPDRTLYFASIQTSPFTRPPLDELIQGLGYVKSHGYPARGTVAEREPA